jgi:hypothetical protein
VCALDALAESLWDFARLVLALVKHLARPEPAAPVTRPFNPVLAARGGRLALPRSSRAQLQTQPQTEDAQDALVGSLLALARHALVPGSQGVLLENAM